MGFMIVILFCGFVFDVYILFIVCVVGGVFGGIFGFFCLVVVSDIVLFECCVVGIGIVMMVFVVVVFIGVLVGL